MAELSDKTAEHLDRIGVALHQGDAAWRTQPTKDGLESLTALRASIEEMERGVLEEREAFNRQSERNGALTCAAKGLEEQIAEMERQNAGSPASPSASPEGSANRESDRMEKALRRVRQGYFNILEFRQLDSEKWGQRDGYGGRYGALTRDEIETVIAEVDAALPNPESQKDNAAASNGLPESATDLRAQVEALIVERDKWKTAYGGWTKEITALELERDQLYERLTSAVELEQRRGDQIEKLYGIIDLVEKSNKAFSIELDQAWEKFRALSVRAGASVQSRVERILHLEKELDQARVRMEAAERECILISDIAKDWRSTSGTPISDVITTSQFVDLLAKAAHTQKARISSLEEALRNLLDTAKSYRSDILGLHCESLPTQPFFKLRHAPKRVDRDRVIDEAEAALSSTTPPQTGNPTDTEMLSVLCRTSTTLCELHSLEEPDGHDFVLDDGWRDAVAQRSDEIIALCGRLRAAMGNPANPTPSVEAEANRESE